MTDQDWKAVSNRYSTPEKQAHWEARKREFMPAGFDQDDYNRKWADLGARIAADLSMDPASDKARTYWAEWSALLGPFMNVADAPMKGGAIKLWGCMNQWKGDMATPLTSEVWEFIKPAATAQRAGTGFGPE